MEKLKQFNNSSPTNKKPRDKSRKGLNVFVSYVKFE